MVDGNYRQMKTVIAIDPQHDPKVLAAIFRKTGRLRIRNFLDHKIALALRDELVVSPDWRRVINGKDKIFEIARADFAALNPVQRRRIEDAIRSSANQGFQFTYETIRVSEGRADRLKSSRLIDAFLDFMNAPATLEFFCQLIETGITLIDGQATAYGPGDFLTQHDDEVAGKNRVAAYVLGLTENWRPDWGGSLEYHAASGKTEKWVPEFNSLAVFKVPQQHSVCAVSPEADCLRLSITGWLRTSA